MCSIAGIVDFEGNAALCREAGVDIIVAGSAVYKADDPEEVIRILKS